MGKRKTASKPVKKIKQTLDVTFTCLFCNHEKSVICTLDKRNSLGELHCKICGQSFQTAIHSLSQPIDIYSDWIDACEDLAEQADGSGAEAEEANDEYSDGEYNTSSRKAKDPVLDSDDEDDY